MKLISSKASWSLFNTTSSKIAHFSVASCLHLSAGCGITTEKDNVAVHKWEFKHFIDEALYSSFPDKLLQWICSCSVSEQQISSWMSADLQMYWTFYLVTALQDCISVILDLITKTMIIFLWYKNMQNSKNKMGKTSVKSYWVIILVQNSDLCYNTHKLRL